MMSCYLTGVPLQADGAWVLDVMAARRYRGELVGMLATIDRQIETLGPSDKEVMVLRGSSAPVTRFNRRLLCKDVADTFAQCLGRQDLFIPFGEWRKRRSVEQAKELASSRPYGAAFAAMSGADQHRVVRLGLGVIRRLVGGKLSFRWRTVLVAGVCCTLRDRPVEEIVRSIRECLQAGGGLVALGVAQEDEAALIEAMRALVSERE